MATYRERIDRYLESHPGATVAEARGHGKTPEHPGQGQGQERFADYYERRNELERHVNSLKQEAYGSLPNYNSAGAEASTHSMSMATLAKSEAFDSIDDMEEYYGDDLDDAYGYYH